MREGGKPPEKELWERKRSLREGKEEEKKSGRGPERRLRLRLRTRRWVSGESGRRCR